MGWSEYEVECARLFLFISLPFYLWLDNGNKNEKKRGESNSIQTILFTMEKQGLDGCFFLSFFHSFFLLHFHNEYPQNRYVKEKKEVFAF